MSNRDSFISTALLATAAGARVMTDVSATTHVFARANLVGDRVARITKLGAAGELVGDKLPGISNRNDGAALVGRVAAGAVIGAVIGAATQRDRTTMAIAGGVIAFLSAQATYRMRRGLSSRMPALAAALVEDLSILGIASVGAAFLDDVLAVRASGASSTIDAVRP